MSHARSQFPLSVVFLISGLFAQPVSGMTPEEEFFEVQVRPLLVQHCVECHGTKKQQGGIRLDTHAGVFKNTEVGPLVVAGKVDDSRIWQVLLYSDYDTQMPPAGKLSDKDLAVFRKWIETGAVWPISAAETAGGGEVIPRKADGTFDFVAASQRHWSYRPVENTPVPKVQREADCVTSTDRFVEARLEAAGLAFSPDADRRTLLRRLKFDLHGLAPTAEEVDAFVNDTSPNAYVDLVDRLLAAPEYGQRWARHWLDVARYADTKGYVFTDNRFYPNAYTYRDYVVEALNTDKPYDRFLLEQLAADQLGLPENDPAHAAMGFLTVGPRFLNREPDIIDDRIDLVCRGLMGMTMACARCHDHKYDPMPTADYYSLYGVFASCTEPEDPPLVGDIDLSAPQYKAFNEELAKRRKELDDYCDKAHAEALEHARQRAADYLQALLVKEKRMPEGVGPEYAHGQPRDRTVQRWIDTLRARARDNDPAVYLWSKLSVLPAENFAAAALDLINQEETAQKSNVRLLQAFKEQPPQNVRDVAKLFGKVLADVQEEWTKQLEQNADATALADPQSEQLRRVVLGPGSLTDLPGGHNSPLFERDNRDQIRKLNANIQTWMVTSDDAPPRAMTLVDKEKPTEPVIFIRGNNGRRGDRVPRRTPQILDPAPDSKYSQGSGRLELAKAIVDPENPLTARVLVNRVWLHHFGVGIVDTPSDFGTRGSLPTHPELLDHLAWRFVHEFGWSMKALHREILLSRTYRQSSLDREAAREVDPENRLYWRQNRRRLDFEAMRDMMQQVAGQLDLTMGGRPVDIIKEPLATRRALYALIDRNNLPGLLRTFDFPAPDSSNPQRVSTTVPQQTLYTLNAPFVQHQAKVLGEKMQGASTEPAEQVNFLVRRVYARSASEMERKLLGDYLTAHPEGQSELAQALLMSNEFFFVD
ncbi:MAG: PSD1 domain-containing protein [Planctomycetaceae bacterium]|nr:PSD1 domain-containing protein [Planctomycetaceae bacterium]